MNNDENWIWDYQYEDIPDKMDYDTWRSETGCSDTPENRGGMTVIVKMNVLNILKITQNGGKIFKEDKIWLGLL